MAPASHWSVLQLSQSWSSSYQIVVPAPSSGWVTRGCFQGKLSWDLSSFSPTHANLYLLSQDIEKNNILNLLYLDFCFVQSYFQTSGQTVEALLSNIPVKLNLLTAKNRDSHV